MSAMLARTVLRSNARAFHISAAARAAEKSALEVQLRDGLKTAMKAKDKPAVHTIKSILSDVTNLAKSGPNPDEPATQEGVINTIRKGIEKRKSAAAEFDPSSEHAVSLLAEVQLLQGYMPAAPTPEAVQALIDEIVGALPEDVRTGRGATGQIMKSLWERLGDARAAVDKKDVAARVAAALKK